MTVKTAPKLRWIAEKDGIAHARASLGAPRALCGALAINERHAWPERSRCPLCAALAVV